MEEPRDERAREVFNSRVIIANLVPFVNCPLNFCMVMVSTHKYELIVKQTKLLSQRVVFVFVFVTKDRLILLNNTSMRIIKKINSK